MFSYFALALLWLLIDHPASPDRVTNTFEVIALEQVWWKYILQKAKKEQPFCGEKLGQNNYYLQQQTTIERAATNEVIIKFKRKYNNGLIHDPNKARARDIHNMYYADLGPSSFDSAKPTDRRDVIN